MRLRRKCFKIHYDRGWIV